jgi:hypothetical protein
MQRLIVNYSDNPSFTIPWVQPLIEKYFKIVEYHSGMVYDPQNDFPLIPYASRITNPWFEALVQKGHKLIVDHLWDSDVAITPIRTENELELRCPNWMWYLSSLEFEHHGYKSYVPQREKKHSFLMLMNNPRWHRDALLNLLHNVLPTALYSYNSKNITMPGDNPGIAVPWQRYMNPDWYNHTAFSLVAESYMRNTMDPGPPLYTEVSEKIFKPLSYRHPFIVAGSVDTLKYLHAQGFETFDTWFDESYDNVLDDRVRLAMVCNEADKAVRRWHKKEIGWDTETLRRLEHNHHHMFDRALVERRFIQEIINPVLEFVCEH